MASHLKCAIATLASFSTLVIHAHEAGGPSVYEHVSNEVATLSARLSEVELENRQSLQARKAQYDAKYLEQVADNNRLVKGNSQLAEEITDLRQVNTELRHQGMALQEDNRAWREDWQILQQNITTALEVASHTLSNMNDDSKSNDLKVLDELTAADARQAAQMSHSQRFNEIVRASSKDEEVSLLGIGAVQPGNPSSILKVLDAGLRDMASEHGQNIALLDAQYFKIFQEQLAQHHRLVDEQTQLLREKEETLQIAGRLRAAVKHLTEVNEALEQQGRAIRGYASRLGIRSLPSLKAGSVHREQQTTGTLVQPHRTEQVEATSPSDVWTTGDSAKRAVSVPMERNPSRENTGTPELKDAKIGDGDGTGRAWQETASSKIAKLRGWLSRAGK